MTTGEKLAVYTVPSTWVRSDHFETGAPYDRIIGMTNQDGERLWSSYTSPDDPTEYPTANADEVLIPTTPEFSARLLDFFKTYQVEAHGPFSNCHMLGRAMCGDTISIEAQDHIMQSGELVEVNLSLGQVGIIGYRQPGLPLPLHTIVGLGEDNPDSVQVMAAFGYLGIRSNEETKRYHYMEAVPSGMMQWPFPDGYGVYALPSSQQEAA